MINWIGIFLSALILAGCSSTNGNIKQPPKPNISLSEYKMGIGDMISVNVWKSPELSVNLPIRPDGRISLPLIGDVVASGKTTVELSATLSTGFNKFVRNAQVTVIVTNPSSGEYLRRVRVTGAIVRQVSLPHQQGMTVLDLVLAAGGTTAFAKGNKATLYRKIDETVKVYPIYLKDILEKGQLDTNYTLYPSDIVTVPERSF